MRGTHLFVWSVSAERNVEPVLTFNALDWSYAPPICISNLHWTKMSYWPIYPKFYNTVYEVISTAVSIKVNIEKIMSTLRQSNPHTAVLSDTVRQSQTKFWTTTSSYFAQKPQFAKSLWAPEHLKSKKPSQSLTPGRQPEVLIQTNKAMIKDICWFKTFLRLSALDSELNIRETRLIRKCAIRRHRKPLLRVSTGNGFWWIS